MDDPVGVRGDVALVSTVRRATGDGWRVERRVRASLPTRALGPDTVRGFQRGRRPHHRSERGDASCHARDAAPRLEPGDDRRRARPDLAGGRRQQREGDGRRPLGAEPYRRPAGRPARGRAGPDHVRGVGEVTRADIRGGRTDPVPERGERPVSGSSPGDADGVETGGVPGPEVNRRTGGSRQSSRDREFVVTSPYRAGPRAPGVARVSATGPARGSHRRWPMAPPRTCRQRAISY